MACPMRPLPIKFLSGEHCVDYQWNCAPAIRELAM